MEKIVNQQLFYLPGRLRFKLPAIYRMPWAASYLEKILLAVNGVLTVNANPITGKILITFDEKKATAKDLGTCIRTEDFSFSFFLAVLVFLLTRDFRRSITMLIVASPCAAGMAVRTAISAAIGNAARRGILIKEGAHLEKAGKIASIFFEQTATLTTGKPTVTSVTSLIPGVTTKEILALAAAEGNCEILLGSQNLMEQHQIDLELVRGKIRRMKHLGETILFLARGERILGLIGVKDTVREESREAVRALREEGIDQIGLLTGDHWETAHLIGEELGLAPVYSQALPDDKLKIIREEQGKSRIVAMVGDGIPALGAADLGIAMGTGNVAIEAADIFLVGDDPRKIVSLVRLSKQTSEVIDQSFTYSLAINGLGVVLGALNLISPLMGAVLHSTSTLIVVINSIRLCYFQPDQGL